MHKASAVEMCIVLGQNCTCLGSLEEDLSADVGTDIFVYIFTCNLPVINT